MPIIPGEHRLARFANRSLLFRQVLSDDITVKQVVADKTEKDIDEVRPAADMVYLTYYFIDEAPGSVVRCRI